MIRSTHACALALMIAFTCLAACGDDGGSPAIDASTSIDGATVAQTCDNYCSRMTANCTAANSQYGDPATCPASCAHWAAGTAADMAGNTLGCRIYHSGAAATNPGLHCRHAGPGGNAACGADCEGFCTLVLGACAAQAMPPYASMGACMTACAGYATTPPYSAAETGGNTFACRLYHATAASTNPGLHCAHTGESTAVGQPCR
jgi:hypothetical protein